MARISAENSDLPVGSCVFATAGSLWGCWLFEVGKWFHRLLQVRHFFFISEVGVSLAYRRRPVLVIVGTLWFWRPSEMGCSAMRFSTSTPSQDRNVGRTDFLESI